MFVRETDRHRDTQRQMDRDRTGQTVHKLRMTLNLVLLPPTPRDCRHAQPCLIYVALELDARALEMLGKHSAC